MATLTRASVVAAVSPGGHDDRVVSWAAREAARRGTRLLLTVLPASRDEGGARAEATPGLLGPELRLAVAQEPGLEVGVDTGTGDGTTAPGCSGLVDLSEGAALLVLGSGSVAPPGPGSVATLPERLAVRAGCPVVLLPPRAQRRLLTRPTVVAGWGPDRSDCRALVVAASEAAARAAWLTVVAALRHEDGRPGPAVDRGGEEASLLAALTEVSRTNPHLVVDLLHRRGPLSEELARAAEQADLLVIGCQDDDLPWSDRPESVAGSLLRAAPCPLMLVGATVRHPVGDVATAPHERATAPPHAACA